MTKHYPLFIASLFFSCTASFAQDFEEEKQKIQAEAYKLYQREMASWYGTDLLLAKFADKQSRVRGYISYVENGKGTSVFYTKDEPPKVIAKFTFDSTYNVNTAIVDDTERDLTANESDLVAIRTNALKQFSSSSDFFKMYKDMNGNFIPLIDELGKRVYILTGPTQNGVVVFGNDYLLTYDNENNLVSKKQLHKNIIVIETGNKGDKKEIGSMHSHLPETGDLITATDICTLMLYSPFTSWEQHMVISPKAVSIWNCGPKTLVTISRTAWDNMNGSGDKEIKKKKKK